MEAKHKELIIEDDYPTGSLVLTRRLGQGVRVTLGDLEIDVVLVQQKANQVRLAIRAPKEYGKIDRITYKKLTK